MDRHSAHRHRVAAVRSALGRERYRGRRRLPWHRRRTARRNRPSGKQQRFAGLGLEAVVLRHHRRLLRRVARAIPQVVAAKSAPSEGDSSPKAAKALPNRRRNEREQRQVHARRSAGFPFARRPGKIEIIASKPMATQRDLSLAYSPASPCRSRRSPRPGCAYDLTAKGNLVAVISNGTAILGLGNLGALAAKPVMEGKAVLFKRFADVDSIDLEVDTTDAQSSSTRSRCLGRASAGSTWKILPRPMLRHRAGAQGADEHPGVPRRSAWHRDHHRRGLINACFLTGREFKDIKFVVNGAARRRSPAPS